MTGVDVPTIEDLNFDSEDNNEEQEEEEEDRSESVFKTVKKPTNLSAEIQNAIDE